MKKTILLFLTLTLIIGIFVSCDSRSLDLDDQTGDTSSQLKTTSDNETSKETTSEITTAKINGSAEDTDTPLGKGNPKETEIDTSTLPAIPEILEYKTVILPISKREVRLDRRYFDLWETVNQELLEKADQKILDAAEIYKDSQYIVAFGEENGELGLYAEFIVDIAMVNGKYVEDSACGDHKHVFVSGQITFNNIK